MIGGLRLQRFSRLCGNATRFNSGNAAAAENAAKTARAARRAATPDGKGAGSTNNQQQHKQQSFPVGRVAVGVSILAIFYAVYDIEKNPEGAAGQLYVSSGLAGIVNWLRDEAMSGMHDVFEPSSDKLIPDFPDPSFYGPTPPGAVAPPLLVVDLEKTLVGSVYDISQGWRHAKRPGVDRFIKTLSNYYEIAIFSENDTIIGPEVWEAIDKENRCHHLTSNAGELKNNRILKRLDKMNRDIRKIILIDDNTITSSLYPRNTLLVKPFTNLDDQDDSVLMDLIPLLQAFVHEDCKDFRDSIDSLGSRQAEEAVVEYQMRVSQAKAQEFERRNKGLGGLIRTQILGDKAGRETIGNLTSNQSSILRSVDIVGSAPHGVDIPEPAPKKSTNVEAVLSSTTTHPQAYKPAAPTSSGKQVGAFFQWLDKKVEEKEEHERAKREMMNEVYGRMMMEKAKKKEAASAAAAAALEDV